MMVARRRKFLKLGLLPRMDAYRKKDGSHTYRFKNYDGTYTKLGSDLDAARKQAAELLSGKPIEGSIGDLAKAYFQSSTFKALAPRTQKDYDRDSKPVLAIFGRMVPSAIKPSFVARYLRVERSAAPVKANREMAWFSALFQFGIDQGRCEFNPCRQVRRNKETPRSVLPETDSVLGIIKLGREMGRAYRMAALIACTVAITGNRRQDVLGLTDFNAPDDGEGVRVVERKRKPGAPERVRLTLWSDSLRDVVLEARIIRVAGCTFIFSTEQGDPYCDSGFQTNWGRLNREWRKRGGQEFTAHDLRAYFVTEKTERGENPETHANKATEAKIYDRRRVKRTTAIEL